MKFVEKYIELRSIVKKWGLKKIKTKNILADWGKLKHREKFSRISVDWRWNPATIGSHLKLKVEEDYKKITRFYARPTVIYVLVFLPSVVSFYKKL